MRIADFISLTVVYFLLVSSIRADEVLVTYEGQQLPPFASPAWIHNKSCGSTCGESVENGHLRILWPIAGLMVNYAQWIARPPEIAPPSLWVEWRFRSNHPIGPIFDVCDAWLRVHYAGFTETVDMYGNWASSFDGTGTVSNLSLGEFHTYRLESEDGVNYRVAVNGNDFIVDSENNPNGYHSVQFAGNGGCLGDEFPNMENAWDFIRYGTISYGEAVVDSDPPVGDVSAMDYPDRTRFTVTYDSPNYVYVDEISVTVEDFSSVTPVALMNYPMVLQTRRLDNGPPEVVEIVLDKPIPHAAVTTFTLTDGVATNIIAYTLSPADADGDGLATLSDFAHFQNCFRPGAASAFCRTFDLDRNHVVTSADYGLMSNLVE